MKKIKLIAIDTKFIHSNLAVLYIKEYAKCYKDINIEVGTYTINQRVEQIVQSILDGNPEIIAFSCYIWNIEMVQKIVSMIKHINSSTTIILGGPEVTYNPDDYLHLADYIVVGEGERAVSDLIYSLQSGDTVDSRVIVGLPVSLDDIPFVYKNLEDFTNRIIYYETSRGCPYKCAYCLSANDVTKPAVRFLSLDRVFSDLKFFLDNRIRQVKFVDRTFNCDKQRTQKIIEYIVENDNGYTNFHFEVAAEILSDRTIHYLKDVRKGLFQLEIGVQSTNEKTLEAINRITKPEILTHVISNITQNGNIHVHLDLIAGLPYEGIAEFEQSFNFVYGLKPHQFQLGFLKVLKGSPLENLADSYGIVHSEYPPYQVLKTNFLSYDQVCVLGGIEEMVEIYYNSNRFKAVISYIESFFTSKFSMYYLLSKFYAERGYNMLSHSKIKVYDILFEFFAEIVCENRADKDKLKTYKWCAKFDIYSHEKAKKLPDWLDVDNLATNKNAVFDFYDNEENVQKYLKGYANDNYNAKQLIKQAHIEIFDIDPLTRKKEKATLLFNYKEIDILGNALVSKIQI